jgi:hypothetical protein
MPRLPVFKETVRKGMTDIRKRFRQHAREGRYAF